MEVLAAIRLIRQECPGVHLICGLSNVSYGLPNRKVLNRVFLIQTMTMGMDAYILDPLDKTLMGYLYASQALLAQDPFCANYLGAYRKGLYGANIPECRRALPGETGADGLLLAPELEPT